MNTNPLYDLIQSSIPQEAFDVWKQPNFDSKSGDRSDIKEYDDGQREI